MEITELGLSEERLNKLKEAIDKRFGQGYFSLNAGIHVDKYNKLPGYEYSIQFNNFSSVSGWATIGAFRWDDKKQRYIITFRGPDLGRTGRYS